MTARSPMSETLPAGADAAAAVVSGPAPALPGSAAVVRSTAAQGMGPATLRAWFAAYLSWLIVLTGGSLICLHISRQGAVGAIPLWLACLGTFYLSLANGLLPLPTMWMIMLLASDAVGLPGSPLVRVVMVATITAIATGMANLNEYHILHWALGSRTAGKVTNTRLVQWAIRWFRVSPFGILTLAALIPIPIDAIRWIAIADGYSRLRFFWAYALGRWVRYAVLAGATIWLRAGVRTIIVAQAALIVVAAVPVLARIVQRRR